MNKNKRNKFLCNLESIPISRGHVQKLKCSKSKEGYVGLRIFFPSIPQPKKGGGGGGSVVRPLRTSSDSTYERGYVTLHTIKMLKHFFMSLILVHLFNIGYWCLKSSIISFNNNWIDIVWMGFTLVVIRVRNYNKIQKNDLKL